MSRTDLENLLTSTCSAHNKKHLCRGQQHGGIVDAIISGKKRGEGKSEVRSPKEGRNPKAERWGAAAAGSVRSWKQRCSGSGSKAGEDYGGPPLCGTGAASCAAARARASWTKARECPGRGRFCGPETD